MAIANVRVLQRAQAKIEAVRGTAEAVMTRWITGVAGGITWSYEADTDDTEEMTRDFGTDIDTAIGISRSKLNFDLVLSHEEMIWWLGLALKGGSATRTGTTTGSTPPGYTYAVLPTVGIDDLDTFTFKCGDLGVAYKFDRCVVNTFTMNWNPLQGGTASWRASIEVLGRFQGTTTFDSPTDITRTKILSRGTIVYLDTVTIGTTTVNGRIRSGSITIANNIEEKQFTEDTLVMSADFGRGRRVITGELVAELKDDTYAAIARAGTRQKLRIKQTGTLIGSTPTTNFLHQVDIPVCFFMPTIAPSYAGENTIHTIQWLAERSTAVTQPITVTEVISAASVTA